MELVDRPSKKSKFRPVNSTLGKHPSFGPIPADQLLPWTIIVLVSLLMHNLLQLNFIWTFSIAAWGVATWWILTANGSWRILSKFINPPNWVRIRATYKPIVQTKNRINRRKYHS